MTSTRTRKSSSMKKKEPIVQFTFTNGLVLRNGQRSLELVRVLSEDELQFEDTQTRRPQMMTNADVLKRIWSGQFQVVLGGVTVTGASKDGEVEERHSEICIDSIPPGWRAQIDRRLKYIKALQAAHVTRGRREKIAEVIVEVANELKDPAPPSASTVMRWTRRYQLSRCNPLSVLDVNKAAVRPRRLSKLVEDAIERVLREQYFTKARHTLRHAEDCLGRELKQLAKAGAINVDEATISRSTLLRRAQDIDAYQRIASREGEARARIACRTNMGGSSSDYPLQRVEIDHTPLNWVVICERTGLPLGRPVLSIAIDAYSGYPLGFYLSFYGPGVTSVTGVLRNSIEVKDEKIAHLGLENRWLSHGLADEFVLDNGLEFHAKTFKSICWNLGIDITYCRVRTPWLKPHVERFFANLDWLTLVRGRVSKTVANMVKIDPYKDACVTFSDLVKGLTMFIVDVYPLQINQRKLARPLDIFAEGIDRRPPAAYPVDTDQLRLISGMCKELTVDQGGVNLLGLPYGGPALKDIMKRMGGKFRTECRWDPDDLAKVWILDPQETGRWHDVPCNWMDYANGLSWNQHLVIRSFRRQELKARGAEQQLAEARLRLHDFWLDVSRPRRKDDSLLAARAAGFTSSRVLAGESPGSPERPAQMPVSAVEVKEDVDVPLFESVDMD
jgi:putative transposase